MAKSKAPKLAAPERNSVTIEIPVRETDGYIGRRLDLRMTLGEAVAARRVFDGLQAQHARLPNGHHVDRPPDAIRWILNKIYHELYGDADPFSLST